MSANKNLNKAKSAKMDEFYTRREDIEAELLHYKAFFEGKVVYCNCDDPTWSEFWQFFVRVFRDWKIKKLMATHYEPDEKNYAYKLELTEDTNGDGKIDWQDEPTITQIPCNGDFRSAICIEFLKEADIVVTNPPFSLFREYIEQLMVYKKQFLIIGSENNISYKDVFPYFVRNELYLGYTHPKIFRVPDGTEGRSVFIEDGVTYQKFGNICWYTNFEIDRLHQQIDLRGNYFTKEKYPHYENYDAIEVGKYSDIPCDYDGMMGVPITTLNKFSPDQFEIIGICTSASTPGTLNLGIDFSGFIGYKQDGTPNGRTGSTFGKCPVLVKDDGKHPYYEKDGVRLQATYPRMFVKLKHPEERRYPDED